MKISGNFNSFIRFDVAARNFSGRHLKSVSLTPPIPSRNLCVCVCVLLQRKVESLSKLLDSFSLIKVSVVLLLLPHASQSLSLSVNFFLHLIQSIVENFRHSDVSLLLLNFRITIEFQLE